MTGRKMVPRAGYTLKTYPKNKGKEPIINQEFKRTRLTKTSWIDIGKLKGVTVDFKSLWDKHPEEKAKIVMFGKEVETPRWQQMYGLDYEFAGKTHKAIPITKDIQIYLDWANSIGYGKFSQVLLNWYEDGHNYIGAHSDKVHQLKPQSPILSLTLGATRDFVIREKKTKKIITTIPLIDKAVVIMGGDMQKEFTHEIPKIGGDRESVWGNE